MFNVEFYLLNTVNPQACLVATCQLLQQFYSAAISHITGDHANHSMYVLCESKADTLSLDKLLWTFDDISFIPHHVFQTDTAATATLFPSPHNTAAALPTILLGWQLPPTAYDSPSILFNLSPQIINPTPNIKKLIEIIPKNEEDLLRARQHYRAYRELGAQLYHHHMT